MPESDAPLLGFSSDAAKTSIFHHCVLRNFIVRIENLLSLRTSTPRYSARIMDINFSKYFEEAKKYESSNFHLAIMDQDSGYNSYHQESNSDSSLENVTGTYKSLNEHFLPIYLSEDALLEKPEFVAKTFNISAEIEKEDYEITRNMFNTPMTKVLFQNRSSASVSASKTLDTPETILSSSVVSEKSLYDGFNSSDCCSDMSLEIPITEQIILKRKEVACRSNGENYLVEDATLNKTSAECISETVENREINYAQDHDFDDFKSKNVDRDSTITLTSQCDDMNLSVSMVMNNSISSCMDNLSVTTDFSSFAQFPSSSCSQTEPVSNSSQSQSEKDTKTALPKSNSTSRILSSVTNNTQLFVPKEKKRLTMMFSKATIENKENIYKVKRRFTSLTPEKSNTTMLDPNESPDLFADDNTMLEKPVEHVNLNMSLPAKEQYIKQSDNQLLKRLQLGLTGVLPPPSMTLINLSANEILSRLESSASYFWHNCGPIDIEDKENVVNAEPKDTSLNDSNEAKSLLVNVQSSNEFLDKPFPNLLEYRYHGLHHNRSKVSEQIEELCDKFAKRYVGAETQSSFTVFENNMSSPSKRKAQRQRWAVKSPGRRLSHLARRRITFSSASLQVGGSNLAGSRARQILVESRRVTSQLQNRRRSPRKTPKKTPRKSPRLKSRTPSSSAKKKLAMRFKKISGEFEKSNTSLPSTSISAENRMTSLKKALFKSPDHERPSSSLSMKKTLFNSPDVDANSSLFLPSTSGTSSLDSETLKNNPRRALFISPIKNSPSKIKKSPFRRAVGLGFEKKRKRSESEDSHQQGTLSKLPKNTSHEYLDQSTVPRSAIGAKLDQSRSQSYSDMSQGNSVKLPRSMSEDNKPTQTECNNKTLYRTRSDMNMSLNRSGVQVELSDLHKKKLQWAVYEALKTQNIKPTHAQFKVFASVLARVTRRFLPTLTGSRSEGGGGTSERMLRIARQHVFAVVKGKTVDEVVNDFLRNRAKMQKPQGYVALEESNNAKNKSVSTSKENVFQDRGNTIESWEKQKLEQLGKPKSENKIDRIRKVINFGDDNR